MDQQLERVFNRLKKELVYIHYRWRLYLQLFGSNRHAIELINKTAPNVFVDYDNLVFDSMILSLSKLTDPACSRGKDNLSFGYLIAQVQRHDEGLAKDLEHDFELLREVCGSVRTIRHKRIAHNDLESALSEQASPLPGVSRDAIEKALEQTRSIMNKIDRHFNGSTTGYEQSIMPYGSDGRALLIWLQKGLAYEQLEKEGVIERGRWEALGEIDASR